MLQRRIAFAMVALLLIGGGFLFSGCSRSSSGGGGGVSAASYSNLLWSVDDLETAMTLEKNLVILDCRVDRTNDSGGELTGIDHDSEEEVTYLPGELYLPYHVEHIAGAYPFDITVFGDPYLPDDETSTEYFNMLNELRGLGLTKSTPICLYDEKLGSAQGKAFYSLELIGCTNVHILDGGFPAWAGQYPDRVTQELTPSRTKSYFYPEVEEKIYLDLTDFNTIWQKADQETDDAKKYILLDVREAPLYYGHTIAPDSERPGYITHCDPLDWENFFDLDSGLMLGQESIVEFAFPEDEPENSEKEEDDGVRYMVLVGDKGWTSGLAYFALRYAGWPKKYIKNFVGGVRHWSVLPDYLFPMESEACYRKGKNMPLASNAGQVNAKRFAGASAVVDNLVYCIGGYEVAKAESTKGEEIKVKPSTANQAFDMEETNVNAQWDNNLAPLPQATAFPAAAVVDGYIYVMGGLTGAADAPEISDKVYRYDTATDTWQERAPMPAGRWSFAAAAVDHYIFAVGGLIDVDASAPADYSDAFLRYDHVNDVWETFTVPGAPHARRGHALAADDWVIYLVGGFYKEDDGDNGIVNVDLRDIRALDTANMAAGWTQKADLPMDVAFHGATIANTNLYVLGGWSLDGITSNVLEFDIANNRTRVMKKNDRIASIGIPKYAYFCAAYGHEIASIGGYGGSIDAIATTDLSPITHFDQPYIYDAMSDFDPYEE